MRIIEVTIVFFVLSSAHSIFAQDNCNVFLWNGDTCRYEACKYLEDAPRYFQLRREYHEVKDRALEICPQYAVVYKHKSTAYLKTGDFITWKQLIDKAVELDPAENLNYRGWCRFQFFRDYKGAIQDIEMLDSLVNYDIGFCQNGDYHLNVAKGLCYKMIGQKEKALKIIEDQMKKDASSIGLYDHLHVGVLYLEKKEYELALEWLEKQIQLNDLAEAYYYQGLAYKALGNRDSYVKSMYTANQRYLASKNMLDMYTHHVDKIYLQDIQSELAEIVQ